MVLLSAAPANAGEQTTDGSEEPVAKAADSSFEIHKSADPPAETEVNSSEAVEYTITGQNTGDTELDDVTIIDDATDVTDDADYNEDARASSGRVVAFGYTKIKWTGSLDAGEKVTIRYSVTVDNDANGGTLRGVASGSATPMVTDPDDPDGPSIPGEPIEANSAETTHTVRDMSFDVDISAKPSDENRVEPGDTIEYTVTGKNTGETAFDSVTLENDDDTTVLDQASYNDDIAANVGEATADDDTGFEWSGGLDPGESVKITYSVTVDAYTSSGFLNNVVSGNATPLLPDPDDQDGPKVPGTPVKLGSAFTSHRVYSHTFDVSSSSPTGAGRNADNPLFPGDTVEITVKGRNTTDEALKPVSVTDDLSEMLDGWSYNGDAKATINGKDAGKVALDGDKLKWTGALEPGTDVEITYSLKVKDVPQDAALTKVTSGEATPPGASPITPEPVESEYFIASAEFTLTTVSDPASGQEVEPGETVKYTVRVNNNTTEDANVVLIDDVSRILDDAAFTTPGHPTGWKVPCDQDAEAPDCRYGYSIDRDGDQLSWSEEIPANGRISLQYTVKVDEDAQGPLVDVASATVTPQGDDSTPIDLEPVKTTHPITGAVDNE